MDVQSGKSEGRLCNDHVFSYSGYDIGRHNYICCFENLALIGRRAHALVLLHCLLLRWGVSRKRGAPLRKRSVRAFVPQPVCSSTGGGAVARDGKRALGLRQPRHRLLAHLQGGNLRAAALAARPPGRGRSPLDGRDARAGIREALRWAVIGITLHTSFLFAFITNIVF